jgi:NTP pyrophosphatase (non-canonical NTP hydrolase)
MTNEEYTKRALITANSDVNAINERLTVDKMQQILHGALGITTEGGEFVDQVKKHLYYGRKFDRTNVIEECGDILWYIVVSL